MRATIGWSKVARALADLETRPTVEARYRAAGFTPDQLERLPSARDALARALTATEDELELAHPQRTRERFALRDLRRQVEVSGTH